MAMCGTKGSTPGKAQYLTFWAALFMSYVEYKQPNWGRTWSKITLHFMFDTGECYENFKAKMEVQMLMHVTMVHRIT